MNTHDILFASFLAIAIFLTICISACIWHYRCYPIRNRLIQQRLKRGIILIAPHTTVTMEEIHNLSEMIQSQTV